MSGRIEMIAVLIDGSSHCNRHLSLGLDRLRHTRPVAATQQRANGSIATADRSYPPGTGSIAAFPPSHVITAPFIPAAIPFPASIFPAAA